MERVGKQICNRTANWRLSFGRQLEVRERLYARPKKLPETAAKTHGRVPFICKLNS